MNKVEMDLKALQQSHTELKERCKKAERKVEQQENTIKNLLAEIKSRDETITALNQSQLAAVAGAAIMIAKKDKLQQACEAADQGCMEEASRLLEEHRHGI